MSQIKKFSAKMMDGNLIIQIIIGLLAGIVVATIPMLIDMLNQSIIPKSMIPYSNDVAMWFTGFSIKLGILGKIFIGALKAVAPILVFVLVSSSIANQTKGSGNMGPVIQLYLIGTFLAAITAVVFSFLHPVTLILKEQVIQDAPSNIFEVIKTLLLNIVDNPIHALASANYIGILAWACALGFVLNHASDSTKLFFSDFEKGISIIVKCVIRCAPFGLFGLMAETLATTGFKALGIYLNLIFVLLGAMIFVALVINPILVFWKIKRNPYPLVFRCLRESGLTAFFTRSSAANIPVNMELCRKLDLHEDTYSVSIPLGATINMAGAAITITVMTLAAVHTQNIPVDFATAILLSFVAALSACGASGVAGGSLLPLACSLFNIPNDVAMQVVGIGMIIGVIQDSAETALNSSTDVLFTASVCEAHAGSYADIGGEKAYLNNL